MDRPQSFAPLSGHDHVDDCCFYRDVVDEGTGWWGRGLGPRVDGRSLTLVHESPCGGLGELARDVNGGAAPVATNGFFQRDSAGIADAGCDSDNDHKCTKHRSLGRGAWKGTEAISTTGTTRSL